MTFLHRCFSLLMWRLALAALLGAGGYAPAVWAAGIVTRCDTYGPGPGTLQDALVGGGQVNFLCSGTIVVPALIDIYANTTLDAGGRTVTLSGGGANRVFYVNSGAVLTLFNLTVSHGKVLDDYGGGIYNYRGTVNLNHSTLSGNSASTTVLSTGGGGIYNYRGTVNLNHSTLSGNSASVSATGTYAYIYGGGIYNEGGTVNLNDSTLSDNSASASGPHTVAYGGGIYNEGGTVNLKDSTLSGNRVSATGDNYSESDGGGIYNYSDSTVTLANSTLSGNSASATGAYAYSYGGGIDNDGTVTLANSTLSGNSASATGAYAYSYGGGIYNDGPEMILANSTLSGNRVSATGVTMGSYGGGIYNYYTVALTNTLIANSTGSNCDSPYSPPVTDNYFNLADDASCGPNIPGNLTGLDPVLADNGGPTWTHALLRGSNALDRGNCSGGTVTTDQRGVRRPQGSACDIGAYERRWSSSGGGAGVPGISGLGLGGLLVLLPGLGLGWRRFSRRPPA